MVAARKAVLALILLAVDRPQINNVRQNRRELPEFPQQHCAHSEQACGKQSLCRGFRDSGRIGRNGKSSRCEILVKKSTSLIIYFNNCYTGE